MPKNKEPQLQIDIFWDPEDFNEDLTKLGDLLARMAAREDDEREEEWRQMLAAIQVATARPTEKQPKALS